MAETVKMVNLRHRAKSRGDQSNRCGDMSIFRFFQDGGGRRLEFLKLNILAVGLVRRVGLRQIHRAKLRGDWSNCCPDMAIFRFLKMAAHHLGFFNF